MTITRSRTLILALALGVAGAVSVLAVEQKAPAPADTASQTVATVDGVPITAQDLEELGGSKLFSMRSQEYQLKRQIVDDTVAKRLLEKEAATRGITVDALAKAEIEDKVPPVSEAEQKDFYEKNKQRFGTTAEAEALKQIEQGLRGQRLRDRRAAYVTELRAKAKVKVMLEPPRLTIATGDNPAKGPADAPVTIVEFSDFQCPFCSRVTPTIKKLEETYAGKLRIVFRDLPLTQIHPQAAIAAEAAGCANDQGKFWEMHDRLFANQSKLQAADLKQHATELGLDANAFNTCLDSGKHKADWQKDSEEGQRYGLTGTPAFFVNGRLLVGAQPYEAFSQVIDEELDFAANRAGAKGGAAPDGSAKPAAGKKGSKGN
jgi:protein-disulfide isomerase